MSTWHVVACVASCCYLLNELALTRSAHTDTPHTQGLEVCYQPLGTLEAHGGHGRVMAGAMTGAWLDHGTRPPVYTLYAHGADYGSRASNLIIYFVWGEGVRA